MSDEKKVANVEDIEKVLDERVKMNKEAVDNAAAAIQKKRKEITEEEARNALYYSEYLQEMSKLFLRKKRREEAADEKYLATVGKDGLDKRLRAGELTPAEFNTEIKAAKEVKEKAYAEANKQFREYHQKMVSQYQGFWRMGWDDPSWENRVRF